MLLDLLGDIKKESKGFDVHPIIVNDGSFADYTAVIRYLKDEFLDHFDYILNPLNLGKKYYWKTINKGFEKASRQRYDYFLQIADDMRLVDRFFFKAIAAWEAIRDVRKACLNISVDYVRLMRPFWTTYQPHNISFGQMEFVRTGWTDMCMISNGAYLKALNHAINPIDPRWSANKELSSGVGMQISRRLIGAGHSIYSLKKSLVIHDDHPSVMHPELRKENKLITNHNMDRIVATMATMPGREESLKLVIASIIDQVDELRIYANNMIRPVTQHRKLKWLFSHEHAGDIGDAGKFYAIDDITGYHFTIDDDLIYPKDYVFTMISAIERYERRCVVSQHGRTFPSGAIRSYYKGACNRYACLGNVSRDVFAHVVGTGVLAYHTDTIRIPFEIFEASNMADIWFSRFCQQQKIPRVILKHQSGWIRDSNCYDQYSSIYFQNVHDESFQTKIMNSISWSLP